MKSGVIMTRNNMAAVQRSLEDLTHEQVLVGFPADTTGREVDEQGMTNATLGYIHNMGSPAQNIPARPFLDPGMMDAKEGIVSRMLNMGKAAINAKEDGKGIVNRGFHALGLLCQNAVRMRIRTGPFAPLSPKTIALRRAKHKGRKAKTATEVTPLIDTAQMLKAVNYAVRGKE